MKNCVCVIALSLLLLSSTRALARPDDQEQEPIAVVEIGSVPNWSVTDHESAFGPTIAAEFTPIKNWLEIETGLTSLFGPHSTEWSADFLLKKPWDLTRTVEVMAGIGPEWVSTRKDGTGVHSLAGEVVLDFMFWTNAKHKVGWYFEPSYDYSFRAGHERSIGASVGLLIGIHAHRSDSH